MTPKFGQGNSGRVLTSFSIFKVLNANCKKQKKRKKERKENLKQKLGHFVATGQVPFSFTCLAQCHFWKCAKQFVT